MMNFSTTTLADLTTDGKGSYGIAASAVDFSDSLYTYLRITDIRDDGTLNKDDLKSVDDERASQYILKPNDIVFARTGASTGRNYFYDGSDGQFVYAGFLIKFSIDPKKVNPKYIKYYCMSDRYKGWVRSFNTGSTRGNINAKTLGNMAIPIPSRKQQDGIVNILASIDEKIKENTEINKNLLQQAGAIFNKFYDESPNQQPFTSLIEVFGGGTPKTGNRDFWDGPIPFFTPKDAGTPYTFQTEKYITESGLAHCNSRLYHKDTTFVTARGTVGKVSLAGIPMAMNQSCYALASEIVDPLLVYFYVLKAVASLKHKASGAVFDAIVTRDFDSETINVLSDDDAKSVLAIINPMMEAIHNNSEENIRLVALRDSLMPRLMSGEIDVSDIDF